MGLLVNGIWSTDWYDTSSSGGAFVRDISRFRNWITADGGAGPTGTGGFPAEAGRYHLYVSLACPWAHRTLIFRALKGLEALVSISVVEPLMAENGWTYAETATGTADTVNGVRYHHELYTLSAADYSGRVTVPVLWDKKTGQIVSNESADIIRMFNSAFDGLTGNVLDFYPAPLRDEIDAVNETIYETVNNGVYRAGFATTQSAYEQAFDALFASLDVLEDVLTDNRFLTGPRLTEADWRLFTTLIRFDAVYHGHFKTNKRQIADYPALSQYVRELYQYPGVKETVDFTHIKDHYYKSHTSINPTGIVPKGPVLDFAHPHNRQALAA